MLNQEELDLFLDVSNPLDFIEDIMIGRDWTFERMDEDCLTVQVTGKFGTYDMTFNWQDDLKALKFSAMMDLTIHVTKMDDAFRAMSAINSNLWLGHFDIQTDRGECLPTFRYTSLLRGMTEGSGASHLEDMIQIGLAECERYYLTFDLLSRFTANNDAIMCESKMALAMMDVAGIS